MFYVYLPRMCVRRRREKNAGRRHQVGQQGTAAGRLRQCLVPVQTSSSASVSAQTMAAIRWLRLQHTPIPDCTGRVHRRSRRQPVACRCSRTAAWRPHYTGDEVGLIPFRLTLTLTLKPNP